MHVAVVVGTMLLGSWVLNSPDAEEEAGIPQDVQMQEQQGLVPPSPTSPRAYNTAPPQSGQTIERGPGQTGQAQPDATPPRGMAPSGGGQASSGGGQATSPTRMMQMFMPSSPTDPSTGVFGQPIAPTLNALPENGSRFLPTSPTGSAGGFRSNLPSLLGQYQDQRTRSNVQNAPSPASQKAFAGYSPTSGVSPYMNLFRVGGETIDNYTSLVRPQLDQRFLNQKFNRDIRSLEKTSTMQRVDMDQLYRANQMLQGVATPQFHMQSGNYSQAPTQ